MAAFPHGPAGVAYVFANPATAGHADVARDNSEINRRTLFLALHDPADAAGRAALGAILQDNLATVNESIQAIAERENLVTAPRPLTEIPPAGGAAHNLNNVRSQHITKFSGTSGKPEDLYSWLGHVMQCAQGHDLDHPCIILLLFQTSQGAPNMYIQGLRSNGSTLLEIVQALEIRYGELCTPLNALRKLQTCVPDPGAPTHAFLDKLRKFASIVNRDIADAETRNNQIDQMVRDNVLRGLPIRLRTKYEDMLMQQRSAGKPAPTVRQMETEIMMIESKLAELDLEREKSKKTHSSGHDHDQHKRHRRPVYAVDEMPDEPQVVLDEDSSGSESDEDPMEFLISQAVEVEGKYQRGKQKPSQGRILQGAAKRFNKRCPGRQKVAEVTQAQAAGPPSKIPDAEMRRKSIFELLKLANIPTGHCIQCGLPGHRLRQDACAMKDKKLADRSCLRCHQGLHSQDDCTKPIATVSQVQVQDDPLNSE